MVFQIEAYSESHKRFQPNGKAMAMILFFIDINVFFIYLFSFFFSKRQRSLRSSLRFHRIRSAVICNIVTVTGFHPFGLIFTRFFFFFQNDLHTFFSIEEGTGGTGGNGQRQNNFDNRDQ